MATLLERSQVVPLKAGLTTGLFDAMAGWVLFGFPSVAEVRFVLIHPSR
jgi:hypothetical protein